MLTRLTGLMIGAILAQPAIADPTLSLSTDHPGGLIEPGETFQVTLSMSDLGSNEAAGYLAFIGFDPSEVTFLEGMYTDDPFGDPLFDPIVAIGDVVRLGAGIDTDEGQTPTSDDADLAVLTFESIAGGCVVVDFADHDPPTILTDGDGQQITPLVLEPLPIFPTTRLSLTVDYGEPPVEPGDFVLVDLRMTVCDGTEVAGFQAFLEFETAEYEFVHGSYRADPFGLPVITPITPDGSAIDLAAGIDVQNGQPPATEPAIIAELTFRSINGGCVRPVWFRAHEPPTRLSDPIGQDILPLELDATPEVACSADLTRDCIVNVFDLLELLDAWGGCDPPPAECPADLNDDDIVNVFDLLIVLDAWGPCV